MTTTSGTTGTLLANRYGQQPAPVELVEDSRGVVPLLLSHRSVRAFDSEPLDDAVIDTLIAAAQSTATSSNLQTWSVVVVRDPAHKNEVARLAGDQQFIRDAPVFLVFVADWSRGIAVTHGRGHASEGVNYLDSTLVSSIDAAIAAQSTTVAAEALGLGAVYVGAVRNNPGELAELLDLPHGAYPVVGVAVGWPSSDDTSSVKPRLAQHVVRHNERYRAAREDDLQGYDDTLRAYYAAQGRDAGWLDSVATRVRSREALHGRERLSGILTERGLPSR